MIAELNHMIDDVAPQDEAMDRFRANFQVIARCNVMSDGKTMIYEIGSNGEAWLNRANILINGLDLPLVAELNTNLCGIFLHIIYKPACHE